MLPCDICDIDQTGSWLRGFSKALHFVKDQKRENSQQNTTVWSQQ